MNAAPIHVPLADVAKACGVSEHALLTRHWPAHWGVPHHWRMVPRTSTVLVNELFLPELAHELDEAGLGDAARKLLAWYGEIATPESHADFVARHTSTPAEPEQPWFKKGQFE